MSIKQANIKQMNIEFFEMSIKLKNCKKEFTKRNISKYVNGLCKILKMRKHGKLILWEDSHNKIPELQGGISALQFIKTSSIVLHSFDKTKQCFVYIVSCRKFDREKARKFSRRFFNMI